MSGMNMAGQDRGRGPTGEKYPGAGGTSGEQGVQVSPQCDLCARLRYTGKLPGAHPPKGTTEGLRIALVGSDEQTRLSAREMVQEQQHRWALECCQPCPMREPAGHQGPSRPDAPPDVVLIGLGSGDGAGLACVRKLKALAPKLPLLVIGDDCDEAVIAWRCWAGADSYLLKPVEPDELGRAVNSLAQGWPGLCPEAQRALVNEWHRLAAAAVVWFPGLSGREQEIVGGLVAGRSNKEIGDALGIKTATVHVYLSRVYRKLEVHNRKQVVAKALGTWRGGGGRVALFRPLLLLHRRAPRGVMAASLWYVLSQSAREGTDQEPWPSPLECISKL